MVQTAFNTQSLALNTSQGVIELLKSSENQQEFHQNCETIKTANGGRLPQFFNNVVILSGLYEELQKQFELGEKPVRPDEESKAAAEVPVAVLSGVVSAKQDVLNALGRRVKPVMKP